MHTKWLNWLRIAWSDLAKGQKLLVPMSLSHPALVGFRKTSLAESFGQTIDWSLPVRDGSRLHIHEYQNGRLEIHRDRINPEKSPLHAIGHWAVETDLGKTALIMVGVFLVGKVINKK